MLGECSGSLVRLIAPVPADRLPTFIVIAVLANTIAYLVIILPGGIGVREAVLYVGLDPIIGHANAAIVVVWRYGSFKPSLKSFWPPSERSC